MSTRAMVERSKQVKSLGYTGLHAFLFVDHADAAKGSLRELLADAWHHCHFESGQVLFAHEFVGPFLGFAHLRAAKDDLEGLEGLLEELRDRGVGCSVAIETRGYVNTQGTPMSVKRMPCEVVGLVKIWTKRKRTRRVLQSLGDNLGPQFRGASLVVGDFDILLEVQATKLLPLARLVNRRVRDWPGVERIEAGFADMRNEP